MRMAAWLLVLSATLLTVSPIVSSETICNGNGELVDGNCECTLDSISGAECELCSCDCPAGDACPVGCVSCQQETLDNGCECNLNYDCANAVQCESQTDYFTVSIGICEQDLFPVTCGRECIRDTAECTACVAGYYEFYNSNAELTCLECPICENGGTCNEVGGCDCISGFTGDVCQYSNAQDCFDNGVVDFYGFCFCDDGFDPATNCEDCNVGYYGATCDFCVCYNGGTCLGDGACACDTGWTGDDCTTCDAGYYAEGNCNVYCNPAETCNGHGSGCTDLGVCICDNSNYDPATDCDCTPDRWGDNCDLCLVDSYGIVCSGNGVCNNTLLGDGSCKCDKVDGIFAFYGSACEYGLPVIDEMFPLTGSTDGTTTLTIIGSNLANGEVGDISITMGDSAAPSQECVVDSFAENYIACTTPASYSGATDIAVVLHGQTLDVSSYTFNYGAPVITSIEPATVNLDEVIDITIHGENFGFSSTGTIVTIGDVQVTSDSHDHNEIVFEYNALGCTNWFAALDVQVIVTTTNTLSEVNSGSFPFSITGPSFDALAEPHNVSTSLGNEVVTFDGINFGCNNTHLTSIVSFSESIADSACTSIAIISDTEVECTVPPGVGVADITLQRGRSSDEVDYATTLSRAYRYPRPTVTSVTGCPGGAGNEQCSTTVSTTITVAGADFGTDASALGVIVNGIECTSVTITNDHDELECEMQPSYGFNTVIYVYWASEGAESYDMHSALGSNIVSFDAPVLTDGTLSITPTWDAPHSVVLSDTQSTTVYMQGSGFLDDGSMRVFYGVPAEGGVLLDEATRYECTGVVVTLGSPDDLSCSLAVGVGANLKFQILVMSGDTILQASNLPDTDDLSYGAPTLDGSTLWKFDTDEAWPNPTTTVSGDKNMDERLYMSGTNLGTDSSRVIIEYSNDGFTTVFTSTAIESGHLDTHVSFRTVWGLGTGFVFRAVVGPATGYTQTSSATSEDFDYPVPPIVKEVYSADCVGGDAGNGNVTMCPTSALGSSGSQLILTIKGSNFGTVGANVLIGGESCLNVDHIGGSETEHLECELPAGAGTDLIVEVERDSFAYSSPNFPHYLSYNAPEILSYAGCAVDGCSRGGGDVIVFTGTNFGESGATVYIGEDECTGVTHDGTTPHDVLSCTMPAGFDANAAVLVIQQGGTFSSSVYTVAYEQCQPGFYDNHVETCVPCEAGRFTDEEGVKNACHKCPAGSYSEGTENIECTLCPTGKYANETGTSLCVNCAKGTATNIEGSLECYECEIGHSARFEGTDVCSPCDQGSFQASAGEETCEECPVGRWTDRTGQSSCIDCVAGYYNDVTGRSVCDECDPGSVSDAGAEVCTSCLAGSYSDGFLECRDCEAGRYMPDDGASDCDACPLGKAQSLTGQATCDDCAAGYFANTEGRSSCFIAQVGSFSSVDVDTGANNGLELCSAGTFQADSGQDHCDACDIGTYQSAAGQSACLVCETGRWSEEPEAESCDLCAKGYYRLAGDVGCQECVAGTFSSFEGAEACSNCPVGTYSNAGKSTCTKCAAGKYTDNVGTDVCELCAEGRSSTAGAAVCVDCKAGRFAAEEGAPECSKCPPHHYEAGLASTGCTPCGAGEDAKEEESEQCNKCPQGRFTQGGGVACADCPRGQYSSVYGASECIDCDAGSYTAYSAAAQCTACPAGRFTEEPGSLGTSCGGNFDTYECCACPSGKAENSTGSTSCDLCPAGTYNDNQGQPFCTECAPGYFQDLKGKSFCNPCGEGTFASEPGAVTCDQTEPGSYASTLGQARQIACPVGTYSDDYEQSLCTNCPLGRYQDEQGQTACKICNTGESNSNTGAALCPSCAPGKYQDSYGTTFCYSCAVGKHQSLSNQTSCNDCAPGSYAHVKGQAECTLCNIGEFQSQNASYACESCEIGKAIATTGNYECEDCGLGKYTSFRGASQCLDCPAGTFTTMLGTAECTECPAGKFQADTGYTFCENCIAGRFSALAGLTTCTNCASGKFQANSQGTTCSVCADGTYTEDLESITCEQCPAGNYQPTSRDCIPCGASKYSSEPGQSSCEVCFANSVPSESRTECICLPDFYMEVFLVNETTEEYVSECIECPVGADCSDLGTTREDLPVAEGWWRSSDESLTFYRCQSIVHCVGGSGECATGRDGPLCSLCADGYTELSNGLCGKCADQKSADISYFVGFSFLFVFLGSLFAFYILRRDRFVMFEITDLQRKAREEETGKKELAREEKEALEAEDTFVMADGNTMDVKGTDTELVIEEGDVDLKTIIEHHKKHKRKATEILSSARKQQLQEEEEEEARVVGGWQTAMQALRDKKRQDEDAQDERLGHSAAHKKRKTMLVSNVLGALGLRSDDEVADIGTGDMENDEELLHALASYRNNQQFKIIIGLYQIVTVVTSTLGFPWPTMFTEFMALFSFLNFDVLTASNAGCVTTIDFFTEFLMSIIVPACVIGMLILFFFVPWAISSFFSGTGKAGRDQRTREWLRTSKLIWFFFFLVYPKVASTVFQLYACQNIEGTSYLSADMSVECFSSRWNAWAQWGVIAVILFPFGVPFALWLRLYLKRHKFHTRKVQYELGVLYLPYRPDLWFWEIIDMGHKLFLTAVLPLLPQDIQLQTGMFVAVGYMIALSQFDPYYSKRDLRLHTLAQTEILLIFMAVHVFASDPAIWQDPLADVLYSLCLIFLMIFFFVTFFYHFVRRIRKADWFRKCTRKVALCHPWCECCNSCALKKTLTRN